MSWSTPLRLKWFRLSRRWQARATESGRKAGAKTLSWPCFCDWFRRSLIKASCRRWRFGNGCAGPILKALGEHCPQGTSGQRAWRCQAPSHPRLWPSESTPQLWKLHYPDHGKSNRSREDTIRRLKKICGRPPPYRFPPGSTSRGPLAPLQTRAPISHRQMTAANFY